ncbi:hypothetical protein HK100_006143 [Physocladia obscura]|uniref:Uncharacterized protein n=1 Tax=Physocladia obscura TaxID=109957 RepID=A0AAD5T7W7_9FUNG|nr:hypothetical protein HK100_006143 [Physocladia obscura]
MELNRMSMSAFEKCQITTLLGELGRIYTTILLRNAKQYYAQLVDERTGKLFKIYEHIEVLSHTGEKQFAFQVTDKNYTTKSLILQGFIDDLYKANTLFIKERRHTIFSVESSGKAAIAGKPEDNDRLFSCTKDNLAKAIMKMAIQFTKWGENHLVDHDNMLFGVINKLQESLKNKEKTILNLIQERKELSENFHHNVRLATSTAITDIYAELASKSVEINDLRKSRRIEEKKLRTKIVDEYNDLVNELVLENHVMRNRFNEYRTNTVQEMMDIIAQTKKEELEHFVQSSEIPDHLKTSALKTIEYDEKIETLKSELHEINMTLMKVRTMYTIKEQSLKSSFAKKIKKLTEDNVHAEEKLWDSYRNSEARELALRKIIAKNNKDLIAAESRNDNFQKQLKDDQSKMRQTTAKDRSNAARLKYESLSNETRTNDAVEKLKYYEKINVDQLLVELKEKTRIIEELLNKSRNEAKIATQRELSNRTENLYDKQDIRPATATPAIINGKKPRTPVDDLLLRLAATTDENTELKRKLRILTVNSAKKAILGAIPKTKQDAISSKEIGVQTTVLDLNNNSQIFETINPYSTLELEDFDGTDLEFAEFPEFDAVRASKQLFQPKSHTKLSEAIKLYSKTARPTSREAIQGENELNARRKLNRPSFHELQLHSEHISENDIGNSKKLKRVVMLDNVSTQNQSRISSAQQFSNKILSIGGQSFSKNGKYVGTAFPDV